MKQLVSNCEAELAHPALAQDSTNRKSVHGGANHPPSDENAGFVVKDSASANWIVKRIVQAREYAARVETWAALELRRAKREEEFFIARYGDQLSLWLAAELAGRRLATKCIKLPAGTIGFRTSTKKLSVVDKTALVAWCDKTLPEAQRVTALIAGSDASKARIWLSQNCSVLHFREQPAISEISQWAITTGELPDGTLWQLSRDKVYVK